MPRGRIEVISGCLLDRYFKGEKFQAVRAWCATRSIPFWIVTTGPKPDFEHQWQEIPCADG